MIVELMSIQLYRSRAPEAQRAPKARRARRAPEVPGVLIAAFARNQEKISKTECRNNTKTRRRELKRFENQFCQMKE